MPYRLLNARLAAKASIRQVEATLYTDKIGRAADRLIRSWWPQIVGSVTGRMGAHDAAYHAERIIHAMFEQLVELFMGRFEGLANWSHQDSGHDLAKTLPLDYLRASAAEHLVRTGPHAKRLTEAAGDPKPGVIELALSALGLQTTDRAALLREPETTDLSDAEQRELFAKLLFPPLSKGQVAYIVYKPVHGLTWLDRLGNATKAASAKTLAPILIQSFSLGRTPRQVAQDLLPVVDGIQSTARRIARTEGIRIANEAGMEADDALGSLLIGKQILAQLDQNTRPKHRARHGTVYYKNPKRGQKGYDEMPRPPIDPDGSTQWNCRCRLSIILAPSKRITSDPQLMAVFQDAKHKAVADPITYAEWFTKADDKRRGIAVGARRYRTVADSLEPGEQISWEHFLDHKTAEPLPLKKLQAESPEKRAARIAKVRALLAERRRLIQQVGTFGFLLPK